VGFELQFQEYRAEYARANFASLRLCEKSIKPASAQAYCYLS